MKSLFGWLDERLDVKGLRRALLDREVPDPLTWWHTLGSATLGVFLVQAISGMVLATYYSPSPDHAYASIGYIDGVVTGGALLRGMHNWGASAMVVLVLAHMIRVFSLGAYKYPREVNWLVGLVLLFAVLGFSFTGYLLPWDQKAYWATQVGTGIAGTTPLIGAELVSLLRGGVELGAATLTRFYAFHVLWLPAILVACLLPHLGMVIRQGIAPRPKALEDGAPPRTTDPSYPAYYAPAYAATKQRGARFWPDVIAKDVLIVLLTIGVIVLLATLAPPHLDGPADPTDLSYIPRPEWYFLPLYQLLALVPGSMETVVAVGVPTALLLLLIALPFVDTGSKRNLRHRPWSMAGFVVILGSSVLLMDAAIRARAPVSVAEGGRHLSSTEMAGRALFQTQQCGSCHKVAGVGTSEQGPDLTEVGLHHSSAWMHSYIENPKRFHPDSEMPAFGYPKLSHQEIEELAQYLASLRGHAPAGVPPQFHDTFP
ncbi:MAG: cytochrome b N-terminal domain-containing protein [Gemmatimonadales bacterium]